MSAGTTVQGNLIYSTLDPTLQSMPGSFYLLCMRGQDIISKKKVHILVR